MDKEKFDDYIYSEVRIINKHLTAIQIQLAELRVKSGIWGLIGASIPVCIMFAVQYFKK